MRASTALLFMLIIYSIGTTGILVWPKVVRPRPENSERASKTECSYDEMQRVKLPASDYYAYLWDVSCDSTPSDNPFVSKNTYLYLSTKDAPKHYRLHLPDGILLMRAAGPVSLKLEDRTLVVQANRADILERADNLESPRVVFDDKT